MASGSSSSSEKFPLSWYCNGSELYGVGIGAFSLARQMDKRGWPVQLLHSEQGPLVERFKDAGLATRKIDLPRRSTDYSGSLPAQLLKVARGASFDRHVGKALAEGVRAFGGNHVHVRWPSHLRAAVNARRELGGPCFWEMPNFVSDRYPLGINRRFYQRLCRRGGVTVLANSAATGRTVAGGGVEPITFYVATSVDRFEPIAADRAALGVPEDVVLVAIASRLVADKGGMHLLRAAAKHTTTPGGRAV
ncbi:MAG: glycosyltransferase, partial [Planctomycetota bacterium]